MPVCVFIVDFEHLVTFWVLPPTIHTKPLNTCSKLKL